MKYNYNKTALKGLGIGDFLGLEKNRNRIIESAPDSMPVSIFNANKLAKALHPDIQHVKIANVITHHNAKSFVLVPNSEKGTKKLAYFRASQYVSVSLHIGGARLSKPYTIRSNPKDTLGHVSSYTLTIKLTNPGYVSKWIIEHWQEGDAIEISGPLGDFYYQDLRDSKHVLALAGGSGITPFYSMAAAIADGIEDFDMTILYGSRNSEDILLKEEIEAVAAKSNNRVKVVHVLSEEEKAGYEHGFLTAELIKKYAPVDDYSVFMCGPKAMYDFEDGEMRKLGLPKRRIRKEMSGDYLGIANDPSYPPEMIGKEFKLTVDIRGKKQIIPCVGGETLMWALEKAGIAIPSHCRSGECGWCHSKLVSGNVYIPNDADGRRAADKKFGWVHPCATFPESNIELCIYPLLTN